MKKIKKLQIFFACLFAFIFVLNTNLIFAETFHKYAIDVNVRNDGTAHFTSLIDLTSTKGTEYYIPIENLGASYIKNFKVTEVDSQNNYIPYTFVPNWNIKASIDEKANKNGLIKTANGYELAFGIRDYSRKKFILEYDITNFAKILNDSDMIFWRFVNDKMSVPPSEVDIRIRFEGQYISQENAKIWGFGTKGEVNFQDGAIRFRSFEPLRKSNYVTILTQVNKGFFINGEHISKDFEDYKKVAFKGSAYREKGIFEKILDFISRYIFLITGLVILLIVKLVSKPKYKGGYKKGDLKGEYYREIPEKEWWKLSALLESCGFDGTNSIIRAIFLKWIQEGRLLPVTEEEGLLFKKEVTSLKITNYNDDFESDFEKTFFSMLISAAGEDGVLQRKEFSKHISKGSNAELFEDVTDTIENSSDLFIIDKGFIDFESRKKKLNDKGKEFTGKLVKYYNYLKDFTLLDERELAEIKVWKELLIYATLFDVAKVVEKRLENLSPEVLERIETNMGYNYNTMRYMMLYSNSFSRGVLEAYNREVSRGASGSGGFTSIGGGGGSFGGGSGGGSR